MLELRNVVKSYEGKPLLTRVVSAHVMGGCGLAADASRGVLRPDGSECDADEPGELVHRGALVGMPENWAGPA